MRCNQSHCKFLRWTYREATHECCDCDGAISTLRVSARFQAKGICGEVVGACGKGARPYICLNMGFVAFFNVI